MTDMITTAEGIELPDTIKAERLAVFIERPFSLTNDVSPDHYTWLLERGYTNGDRIACYQHGMLYFQQIVPAGITITEALKTPALSEWLNKACDGGLS